MAATPSISSQLFNGLLNVLKGELAALTPDELKAAGPALVTFFTWLGANPGAALNPPLFLPHLAVLQASLLAAQGTVAQELVTQGANQMATLFKTLVTEASASTPAAP